MAPGQFYVAPDLDLFMAWKDGQAAPMSRIDPGLNPSLEVLQQPLHCSVFLLVSLTFGLK